MAESGDGQEKTLDPTPRRLAEARSQGDVVVSREGSSAGGFVGALLAILLVGGMTAHKVGDILYPLIDQPDAFLDATEFGYEQAARRVMEAIGITLAPVFGILLACALLPHIMQNSIAVVPIRLMPKLSHLSLGKAASRMFGGKALFEFAKNIVKMLVVGIACYAVARPIYMNSLHMVGLDIRALMPILNRSIVSLLGVVTLVVVCVAGVDIPYQHWVYRRRHRMSLTEMKDELKETDGNPHIKGKLRRLRMERSRQRMMQDVKKASVVITNPTHYAVALRYERGKDAAPIVVAKGLDLVAQNIKRVARENDVPVIEDRPLARALHAAVEIGQAIPREHFEAVAKIIGLIWAQKGKAGALQTSKPPSVIPISID